MRPAQNRGEQEGQRVELQAHHHAVLQGKAAAHQILDGAVVARKALLVKLCNGKQLQRAQPADEEKYPRQGNKVKAGIAPPAYHASRVAAGAQPNQARTAHPCANADGRYHRRAEAVGRKPEIVDRPCGLPAQHKADGDHGCHIYRHCRNNKRRTQLDSSYRINA